MSFNLNSVVLANSDKVKSAVEVKSKIKIEDLPLAKKTIIDNSLNKCIYDGIFAAESINKLKDNTETFEIGVREVLNKYYSTKKDERKELIAFSKKIDDSAKQILQNYQEAEVERNNQGNMPVETGEIIVTFPYGTPMETINTVLKNEARSFEIIDDGKAHIPNELPVYKKSRLEKRKERKANIVVLAEISLEDTVERAIDKFKDYDCVISASGNALFEADGIISNGTIDAEANDTYFTEEEQWNLKYIDIPTAWNRFSSITSGIWEVWVAVIDNGVQMDHPDLKKYC